MDVTFYITRHGQTVYNVASRVQGWCDSQLTDEGINLAGVVRILDMKERSEERERENEKLRSRVRQLEEELHEFKMQKKITALVPRDGSGDPQQVLRGLLGQ